MGRTAELAILTAGWEAAVGGAGRVVAVCGEAGIGKSRLLEEIKLQISSEQLVACQASPLHGNSALYPLVDFLERQLDLKAAPADERLALLGAWLERTGPHAEVALPLLGALLSLPVDREHPVFSLAPAEQRAEIIATLINWLRRAATSRPLLFVLEDAHWADPTTLELVDTIVAETRRAAILCVVSHRPEFRPSWTVHERFDEIQLRELPPVEAEAVVRQIASAGDLPASVVAEVVERTRGIPLFVEETTKVVLESRRLWGASGPSDGETGGGPQLPATLQDSLLARIDQLGGPKQLLQLASVIGGEFSYEILRAVADRDEAVLVEELQQLLDAGLVLARGELPRATLTFKHALIRDAAYESLRRSTLQDRMDESERARFVAESKAALDMLRTRIVQKLAKSWQKPDSCVRRKTVVRDVELYFPQKDSFDENWYMGPRRERGLAKRDSDH